MMVFKISLLQVFYTRQKKKRTMLNCSTLRKITSDRQVSLLSAQRYIKYCCISHLLQLGVKNVLKIIGHEPSGR